MRTFSQERQTAQVEVVETHNMAISLRRIGELKDYNGRKRKLALYHALGMSGFLTDEELRDVRIAIRLP